VSEHPRIDRSCLAQGLVSALLIACLALSAAARAQSPSKAVQVAAASGPGWSELTPAQRSALAPLKKDWPDIDASRKQKWLEIAARFPSMPAEERQRIQQRMNEWARMTPEERGRARLQFQEARQISPQQRQERWDAYMALPADERRALAASARTVPKSGTPTGDAAARKADAGGTASPQAATKIVAPTVVQAKPGASTTLISKPVTPPPHAQAGQPKIAVDKGKVDRSTLLPQAAPKGAAASAPQ
jgi:hypothetical protein